VRIFNRDNIDKIKRALKEGLNTLKAELDDHRETINQNTNEIQSNYEYLCRLDSKIEKLSERIDELTLFSEQRDMDNSQIRHLTTREKEVFLAIYTASSPVTYKDISRKTGLTENLIICYVSNLLIKGVPVVKKYVNHEVKLLLEPHFKELQMRQNMIGINESVSRSVIA